MSSELFFLQQLSGSTGVNGISGMLLLCLFVVLAFRPERIHSRWLFRFACVLLALAIATPPLASLAAIFSHSISSYGWSSSSLSGMVWTLQLANTCGPVFAGGGALCGLFSMIAPGRDESPSQPTRHPLD
ncbi:MAG: hypothetical protein ABFD16_09520 [Thermoguttaceae bacterium]|jgi:hypothetical protein